MWREQTPTPASHHSAATWEPPRRKTGAVKLCLLEADHLSEKLGNAHTDLVSVATDVAQIRIPLVIHLFIFQALFSARGYKD